MVNARGVDLRNQRGFTLIELLIVMIIMAILMAIAIPIFLGQRQKAQATKAKAHASIAQKSLEGCAASTVDQTYTGCANTVPADEPSLLPFITKGGGSSTAMCAFGTAIPAGSVCASSTANTYSVAAATEDSGGGYVVFTIEKTAGGINKRCIATGSDTGLLAKMCPSGRW